MARHLACKILQDRLHMAYVGVLGRFVSIRCCRGKGRELSGVRAARPHALSLANGQTQEPCHLTIQALPQQADAVAAKLLPMSGAESSHSIKGVPVLAKTEDDPELLGMLPDKEKVSLVDDLRQQTYLPLTS